MDNVFDTTKLRHGKWHQKNLKNFLDKKSYMSETGKYTFLKDTIITRLKKN